VHQKYKKGRLSCQRLLQEETNDETYRDFKTLRKGGHIFLPATGRFFRELTGDTDSARYCYAVWLRHLTMSRESGLSDTPRVVAELGPGDSIGIGIAALLTGAEKYYAFDVCRYATNQRNIVFSRNCCACFQINRRFLMHRSFPGWYLFLARIIFRLRFLLNNAWRRLCARIGWSGSGALS